MKTVERSEAKVLPLYNVSDGDYVTTYRCGNCAPAAFRETAALFEKQWRDRDEPGFERFVEFFRRHGIYAKEFELKDMWFSEEGRAIGLGLIASVESGDLPLEP